MRYAQPPLQEQCICASVGRLPLFGLLGLESEGTPPASVYWIIGREPDLFPARLGTIDVQRRSYVQQV
jgi:hypothetical protein